MLLYYLLLLMLLNIELNHELGTEEFNKTVGSDIVRLVINAITIVVVAVPEGIFFSFNSSIDLC